MRETKVYWVKIPFAFQVTNARDGCKSQLLHPGDYQMEKITNPVTKKPDDEKWFVISGSLVGMPESDFEAMKSDSALMSQPIEVKERIRKAS